MKANTSTISIINAFKQAQKAGCPITIRNKSVLVPIDLIFNTRKTRKGEKIFIVNWDDSKVINRLPSYWYDTSL